MPDLILVAAGGLAREVLSVVELTGSHRVLGFVDDGPDSHGSTIAGLPVLGPLEEVKNHDGAEILVCAGAGASRRDLVERLTGFGILPVRYASIRHPSVVTPASCTIGSGSILLANVVLTAAVSLGRHVVAMPNVTLTHDDAVGDYATLCAGVSLGGHVVIGEAAYLGMNASLREGTTVGAGATLGMGSVLLDDLPAWQTWVGVPAAPIKAHRGDVP